MLVQRMSPKFYENRVKRKRLVESRVQFLDFNTITITGEQFRCNILIKSKWKEEGNIETYNPEILWNPYLYVENLLKKPGWYEKVWYTTEVFENYTVITEHKDILGL